MVRVGNRIAVSIVLILMIVGLMGLMHRTQMTLYSSL